MKIQGSDILISRDPLSYASGYTLLAGSPHQTYDPQARAYDPKRANVPLVVMPWVSADDPQGEHSGSCALKGVSAVYRHMAGGAWTDTVIDNSDTARYFISEGAEVRGVTAPRGAVVLMVDVPPTEAAVLLITATVTDAVDGLVKSFPMTVELTTKTASTVTYRLRASEEFPVSLDLDPRDFAADASGSRLLKLSVQLYGDNVAVADAVYFWRMWQDGQWVKLSADNQLFLRTAFVDAASGELPGSITVDLQWFDTLRLMVCASPVGEIRPSEPDSVNGSGTVYFTYRRVCSANLQGFVFGDLGIKVTGDEEVSRYLQLRDSGGDLTEEDTDEHFRIDWKLRVGGSTSHYSRGRRVSGRARTDFGATPSRVASLLPEVSFVLEAHLGRREAAGGGRKGGLRAGHREDMTDMTE